MFGDFSRDSFDACRQYTRVLMQQGRPLTDADWNEQVSALWNHIYALGAATIGWHGSPDKGFCINDGIVKAGTYFIDGIRCVNPAEFHLDLAENKGDKLIYLDLWEHTTNAIEDPDIAEPALSGIDTANRTKIVWAIRCTDGNWLKNPDSDIDIDEFISAIGGRVSLPTLKVRRAPARPSGQASFGPCATDNNPIRQNGSTDRLYRVEIHHSGRNATWDGSKFTTASKQATFKWSRDNGSTIGAIAVNQRGAPPLPTGTVQLDRTKYCSRTPFRKKASVELMSANGWSHKSIVPISDVTANSLTLEKDFAPSGPDCGLKTSMPYEKCCFYYLRQWDPIPTKFEVTDSSIRTPTPAPTSLVADDGAAYVLGSDSIWLELENGLQIQFSEGDYRDGDYWLIRTTSDGQIYILPKSVGPKCGPAESMQAANLAACEMPPRGQHHFAPLGKSTQAGINSDYRGERLKAIGRDYPSTNLPSINCAPCKDPPKDSAPGRSAPAADGPPEPNGCCGTVTQVSLPLSRDGTIALRSYFGATKNLARHFPARFLQYEPKSPTYRRFRSPLLVSDILESSFEKYLAKIERCVKVTEFERPVVEADARADYEQATQFRSGVIADEGLRSPIA